MTMKSVNCGFLILSTILCLAGCKGSNSGDTGSSESVDDNQANVSETAMGAAGSAAQATEGGAFFALDSGFLSKPDSNGTEFGPLATCSLTSARTKSCSGSPATSTITWNNCTVGLATLSGGWSETWGTTTDCNNGALSASGNVTRTSATGSTITFANGAKLLTTTAAHTAYDSTSIPATGITASISSGTRTVTINGIHRTLTGPGGTLWFDHSIVTPTSLTITGKKSTGDRAVSGTIKIFHNRAKYTASLQFNSVTWGDSTCCYPTSGTITGTLTGSVTGSTTMTFSSTCGTASFTETSGSTTSVQLRQCD